MANKVIKVKIESDYDPKDLAGLHNVAGKDAAINSVVEGKDEDSKKEQQKQTKAIGEVKKVMSTGADITAGLLKGTLEFITGIYEKLKKSSPLLETIETLFNLAMTLLFMPLGNALGETFIPMAIDLVDNILSMWELFDDQFNNGDLSGMLTTILTVGVQYIGEFIEDIGSSLSKQGGLIGGIGNVLNVLGDFIQNGLVLVIEKLLTVMTFIMEHFKLFVSVMVGFMTASAAMDVLKISLMLTEIQTIATGLSFVSFGLSALVGESGTAASLVAGGAAVISGAVGTGATYAGLTAMGLAEGGYVPPTQGGQLITIGEGGEGEYVIPESKMGSVTSSSAQTITNNFYGYTQAELVQIVKETLRDELLSSKYTGVL